MNKEYAMVQKFMKETGQSMPISPTSLELTRAVTKCSLVKDKLTEVIRASKNDDVLTTANALTDVMYYTLSMFVEMGIKPESLFEVVHEANMRKLDSSTNVRFKYNGVLGKPDDWVSPQSALFDVIAAQSVDTNGIL